MSKQGENGSTKAYWPHSLLEVESHYQASKGKLVDVTRDDGIKAVKKAKLADCDKIKKAARIKSMEEDSDDFAKGYDSTSSEEAENLMYELEHMEIGKHMPGSKLAFKA